MAIVQLDKIVASRIAAGEVVERPASVVRELLDNSIDAGATRVSVYLDEGGISSITVADNGCGIDQKDLSLACESHATSKISCIEDLFNLSTLGFRGEALPSIAACSKLSISSNGYKITVNNGIRGNVVPGNVTKGTTVVCKDIFEDLPARKQFLKRPSTEYQECRKVFLEKALGFNAVEMLLFNGSVIDLHFKASTRQERTLEVLCLDKNFCKADSVEMNCQADPIKLYALCSKPEIYRRDRGQIKIILNGRVIDNFPLVQVIANAYSVSLPGGAFPWFYLFIEDSPSLVDFNIHPAKRECRIRNQNSIYGPLTSMIRDTLISLKKNQFSNFNEEHKELETVQNNLIEEAKVVSHSFEKPIQVSEKPVVVKHEEVKFDPAWFDNAKKILKQSERVDVSYYSSSYKYIGQVFDTFLVVEKEDTLLLIDQHAAHERLLYDEITSNTDVQDLIVPYRFDTDRSVDDFLLENSVIYSDLGVQLVRVEPMLWEITSIPAVCRSSEEKIASYIRNATGDIEEAKKGLFAVIACHAAIKSGDTVDSVSAKSLIDKVFKLDQMTCPHGRSFVFKISKEDLFKAVGRIL